MIIRARAPLRISLGGGGTDISPYPETKGGVVISTSIDRYAYVTIKQNKDKIIRIISQDYNTTEKFKKFSDFLKKSKFKLVSSAFDTLKIRNQFLDTYFQVDAPPGSGLGSSSAVTVALVGALMNLKKKAIDPYEIANQAYIIERFKAGIKGGMQDQYASAFGGFNFIEFKNKSVVVNPLRLRSEIKNELFASMILADTGITRLSANIISKQIKSFENQESSVLDKLDLIKKLAFDMKDALLKGNIQSIGEILHDSWMSKKGIVSSISDKKIDKLYTSALKSGAIGGKLLGAGGGGHFIFICPLEKKFMVEKQLKKLGCNIVKFNFDEHGLQSWTLDNGRILP